MDQETVGIIATIDDDSPNQHIGHTFRLRSGVVLSFRKVPVMLAQRALDNLAEPVVPQVYLEDKETYEENPLDPDYIKAVEAYTLKRGTLINDLYLGRGTEVKQLPEGFVGPDDDAWIDEAEYLGAKVTLKDNKLARYTQWLYLSGVMNEIEEMMLLVNAVMSYNNLVSEEQVLNEMRYFRHPEERPRPDDSADTEETTDRRDVPEFNTRDSERVRAEGSSDIRFANLVTVPESIQLKPHEASSAL